MKNSKWITLAWIFLLVVFVASSIKNLYKELELKTELIIPIIIMITLLFIILLTNFVQTNIFLGYLNNPDKRGTINIKTEKIKYIFIIIIIGIFSVTFVVCTIILCIALKVNTISAFGICFLTTCLSLVAFSPTDGINTQNYKMVKELYAKQTEQVKELESSEQSEGNNKTS